METMLDRVRCSCFNTKRHPLHSALCENRDKFRVISIPSGNVLFASKDRLEAEHFAREFVIVDSFVQPPDQVMQ